MTILIKCVEREFSPLRSFENEDMAYKAMESDLADAMGMTQVPDDWDNVDVRFDRYEHFDIQSNDAWLKASDNIIWKIMTV